MYSSSIQSNLFPALGILQSTVSDLTEKCKHLGTLGTFASVFSAEANSA